MMLCLAVLGFAAHAEELKPRLVVMTDIGPADVEPDDNESAVRLLAYADRFEIEAICTTIGWNCDPYPKEWAQYLHRVVDAYEHDVKNLMVRSKQKKFRALHDEQTKPQPLGYWPSAEYIRSRCLMGSVRAGYGVIGESNDSEGSEMLIRLAQEPDERPIWVTSWGGSNTLAQAIWRYSQTATKEQLKAFVRKFRIYTITDQDMQYSMRMNRAYSSHMWMRRSFMDDLLFIWDESAWLNQNELGKQNWAKYAEQIQGKGEMGKVYPTYKWGVEGDTPSFLHLMPNGLNNPEDPTQVGWGGYHTFALCADSTTFAWTNWQEPVKRVSDGYEKHFYADTFNDFAARMEWADKGAGNRNPVAVVNGQKGLAPVELTAKAGQMVYLDASKSSDPDGDKLSFSWWVQQGHEAGDALSILHKDTARPSFMVPEHAMGKTFHIICEVHDDGPHHLVAYRRVMVKVL